MIFFVLLYLPRAGLVTRPLVRKDQLQYNSVDYMSNPHEKCRCVIQCFSKVMDKFYKMTEKNIFEKCSNTFSSRFSFIRHVIFNPPYYAYAIRGRGVGDWKLYENVSVFFKGRFLTHCIEFNRYFRTSLQQVTIELVCKPIWFIKFRS